MPNTRTVSHVPTVVLIAVAVYSTAIVLHELGHAVVGALVGGDPTLVSTTDTRGNWDAVSRAGFVAIGVGGSLVNWLLALLALALLKGGAARSGATRWFLWLTTAVNGLIPAVYMIVSPVANFGDWATILSRFDGHIPLRILATACGLALTVGWVRLCTRLLVPLLSAEGLHQVRLAWLSGGMVALVAALLSPLGLAWALPLAVGSTLGTTWPLMIVARDAVARAGAEGPAANAIGPSRIWMATGVVFGAVFVGVFGPGLAL